MRQADIFQADFAKDFQEMKKRNKKNKKPKK